MRNFIWSLMLFSSLTTVSYSQIKDLEKGTYISNNKGQIMKMNLLGDNKYEIIVDSGSYEVKGDSLIFVKKTESQTKFNLSFEIGKKAKEINVKFMGPLYAPFYIGTQKGKEEIKYQRFSDIKNEIDPSYTQSSVDFKIEKADFLYLVYEDYGKNSAVYKYTLPKDVSGITIDYELGISDDLQVKGFYDNHTKELRIADNLGSNPLVFVNEKYPLAVEKTPKILPSESQVVSNWTYPGKKADYNNYNETAVDSTQNAVIDTTMILPDNGISSDSDYKFKLKIEDNLKAALEATKAAGNKFLVVYNDSKKTAKQSFDAFIKDQEKQTGYNMYDTYNEQYDIYNYYLAGENDKKWLKENKITNDPSIVILNGDGDLLAVSKSDLAMQQYQFSYYGDFHQRLQHTDTFALIDKISKNKKLNDEDLIKAFNKATLLYSPYDYSSVYNQNVNSSDFIFTKTSLSQKELSQIWKKLIESHQKDKNVNMYLVETILQEIKNQGFTKRLFVKDRVLDDTDFLAIEYVLNHSDEIENIRSEFNTTGRETHNIGNPISEISNALQQNSYASQDGVPRKVDNQKVISIYKRIIDSGKGNFDVYKNYFSYLSEVVDKNGSNTTYLKEFKTYFDSTLAATSPIEKLDAIFSSLDPLSSYAYDAWSSFKNYHSDLCNNTAWSVVTNKKNANYLKDAIKWSEYSVTLAKNSPYYLDTLAQLYYKDGQKEKAIATETLAVKNLYSEVDPETANEIKEVLTKMQNGTY